MNWRNTSDHQDWYYNHPASQLFANFTEWFEFLKSKKLRTYFNDHPASLRARTPAGCADVGGGGGVPLGGPE